MMNRPLSFCPMIEQGYDVEEVECLNFLPFPGGCGKKLELDLGKPVSEKFS